MKLWLMLLIAAVMLSGCGETRTPPAHVRTALIPLPEAPVLAPDDGSIDRWRENFAAVATYSYKLWLGIREHARGAIENDLYYETISREEAQVLWRSYSLEGGPPSPEAIRAKFEPVKTKDPGQ
jgi:hypothetical protein